MITGLCPFCSNETVLVGDGYIHCTDQLYKQSWCKCGFSTPWRLSRAEVLDDMQKITFRGKGGMNGSTTRAKGKDTEG